MCGGDDAFVQVQEYLRGDAKVKYVQSVGIDLARLNCFSSVWDMMG